MNITPHEGGSPFESIKQIINGVERWSARDLMPFLGYRKWERFEDSIERAKCACQNSGMEPSEHFPASGKTQKSRNQHGDIEMTVADVLLSRYGAYLVAMNGDPRKVEVAGAQTYFAVKTREAETNAFNVPQSLPEALRFAAELAERNEKQQAVIKALAPRAEFADAITHAVNNLTVNEAAKILGTTGERRLFGKLRDWGYLRNNNEPFQRYIDSGLFKVRLKKRTLPSGENLNYSQTLITPKGLAYFQRKYFGQSLEMGDQAA